MASNAAAPMQLVPLSPSFPSFSAPEVACGLLLVQLDDGRYLGPLSQRGRPHGRGTLTFDDGDSYSGECAPNPLLKNGERYDGSFSNGRRHGLGVDISRKYSLRYEGEFAEGERHGFGAVWDETGELRDCGQWEYDCLEEERAVPLRCFPEGKHLCAAAQQAKRNGLKGYALMPSGAFFIGEVDEDGFPDGQGSSFYPDFSPEFTLLVDPADESKSGHWVNGQLRGRATQLLVNGERYDGLFKADQYQGVGVYLWPDGSRYEGEFSGNEFWGFGARWSSQGKLIKCAKTASLLYPDGSYFVGPINAANQRHGKGSTFNATGSLLQSGSWIADQRQPSRKALIIGNDKYAKPVSALECCVNDATDMQSALQTLDFFCVPVMNSKRSSMLLAITAFMESLQLNDLAVIFFSGHGEEEAGTQYLLPTDYKNGTSLRDFAVSLDDHIIAALNRKDCNLTSIIVLDCCRRNSANKTFKGAARLASANSSGVRLPTSGEFFIVKASDPGTVAHEADGERNGWFTSCLLPQLLTPGLRLTEVFGEADVALREKSKGKQRSWITATAKLLRENIVLNTTSDHDESDDEAASSSASSTLSSGVTYEQSAVAGAAVQRALSAPSAAMAASVVAGSKRKQTASDSAAASSSAASEVSASRAPTFSLSLSARSNGDAAAGSAVASDSDSAKRQRTKDSL